MPKAKNNGANFQLKPKAQLSQIQEFPLQHRNRIWKKKSSKRRKFSRKTNFAKKRVSLFVRLPSKFCKNLAAPSKEQLAAALGWSLPPEKELGYPRVCKEKEIKCVCVRKCERERERERQACKECKERPPGLIFVRQNFLTSDVGNAVPHQRGAVRSFSRTWERKAKK